MELFDKKFVYFMWDDELEGKEGFVADSICELIPCVLDGKLHHTKVRKSVSAVFPFKDANDNNWMFFYYDPNHEVKRAYNEGKQIQIKSGKTWYNISGPDFLDDTEYRVKPDCATNYQVAKWLSEDNGQIKIGSIIDSAYGYDVNEDEEVCTYTIRKWGDNEWYEPTLEYMNIKE